MPRKATKKMTPTMQGEGIKDLFKGISKFLKRTKILSTVGSTLGSLGVPIVGDVATLARSQGFGMKKPRKTGKGVRVAGAGVRVAGAGVAKKKKAMRKKK